MDARPPRYAARPFPPYAYVPGQAPHPTRDPAGHSYGAPPEQTDPFDPDTWQDDERYLHAIDLLNHDYWWEAHEALEGLWIAVGRRTPPGRFLQGLIQIGVAMLKRHQAMPDAARRLADAGLAKLGAVPDRFMGVDQRDLRAQVQRCLEDPGAPPVRLRLDRSRHPED